MPLLEEPAPRPWVVLLTGHEHHGKTEAARWLERWEGFARVSFADPLRKSLVALGVPVRAFEQDSKLDPLATHGGRTPRELMQGLGDWCRGVSPDLLSRAWDRGLPPPPASVVADDARREVEVEVALGAARRRGARCAVIRVDRPGWPKGSTHGTNRIPATPDGVDLDASVTNDGSVADLGRAVVALLRAAAETGDRS